MTLVVRVRLVMAMAGVFYLGIVVAGLPGFDLQTWLVAGLLFFVWHLLMHESATGMGWVVVIGIHFLLAALCLGLGHGIGALSGLAPSPFFGLGLALGALIVARIVNISPQQTAELNAFVERATQDLNRVTAEPTDWHNHLSPAEAARVDEVLAEVAGLSPATATPEVLEELALRLERAGPTAMVEERLASTDREHLPNVLLHICFVLRPAPAANLLGSGIAGRLLTDLVSGGALAQTVPCLNSAFALLDRNAAHAIDLPHPEGLRTLADEVAGRDPETATLLRELAARIEAARDD